MACSLQTQQVEPSFDSDHQYLDRRYYGHTNQGEVVHARPIRVSCSTFHGDDLD